MNTKFFVLASMLALALAFCTMPNNEEDKNNNGVIPTFTIQNSTGYYFGHFYIKPSTSTDWGVAFTYS